VYINFVVLVVVMSLFDIYYFTGNKSHTVSKHRRH